MVSLSPRLPKEQCLFRHCWRKIRGVVRLVTVSVAYMKVTATQYGMNQNQAEVAYRPRNGTCETLSENEKRQGWRE